MRITTPTQVGTDADWAEITLEQSRSCGLKTDGRAFCWGIHGYGDDTAVFPLYGPQLPTPFGLGKTWLALDADVFHTCAIDTERRLWCEGRSIEGQLGIATGAVFHSEIVEPEPERRFTAVDVGRFHTCAIDDAGVTLCTGQNGAGQVGDGTTSRRTAFVEVF